MTIQSSEEFYMNFIKSLSFTTHEYENYTIYENKAHPELGYLVRYSKKDYYDIFIGNYTVCQDFSLSFDNPSTQMRFGTVYSGITKFRMNNEPISNFKPTSFFVIENHPKGAQYWHKGQHFHGTEITIHKPYFDQLLYPAYGDAVMSLNEFTHNTTYRYLPLDIIEILRKLERLSSSPIFNMPYMDSKILECIAILTAQSRSSSKKPFPTRHDLVEISLGSRKMYLSGQDVKAIRKAYAVMTENACNPITIQHLSTLVQINEQKLKAGFVSLYHTTIWKYANSIRMSTAANLLCTSEMSIQEISNKVGYPNGSNFTNMFKQSYHMTPREYRKLNFKLEYNPPTS